jgi:hypothetical protein
LGGMESTFRSRESLYYHFAVPVKQNAHIFIVDGYLSVHFRDNFQTWNVEPKFSKFLRRYGYLWERNLTDDQAG